MNHMIPEFYRKTETILFDYFLEEYLLTIQIEDASLFLFHL
jgi:hypothetical protein